MRILIKGAGDLATGIASRLYRCGHQIIMTEIAVPLTVRRKAALSPAVYEGESRVEDLRGVLVQNYEEAERVWKTGDIPIIVDEQAVIRELYQPDVIVDAILAKRNLGTEITDAPFVIGVGPGFTAGEDCHVVVETKRGHSLGSVITRGSAIPNTGVPGNVGGYTIERLIRASADGEMEPVAAIGDLVREGDIVAYTGGKPVYACMPGIVRGMLQPHVRVTEQMKIGDIDARCEIWHCNTISDKARAIGGGVLEAVSGFERMKDSYGIVVLAAGLGSRFGGNKLHANIKGTPLYRHMLSKLKKLGAFPGVIVTGDAQIVREAVHSGITVVKNERPELGISHSLQMGLKKSLEMNPNLKGVLFCVCDQPGLTVATMLELLRRASLHSNQIISAGHNGEAGNPVVWSRDFFGELMNLSGDMGGKAILSKHPDALILCEVPEEELKDIDRKSDVIEA